MSAWFCMPRTPVRLAAAAFLACAAVAHAGSARADGTQAAEAAGGVMDSTTLISFDTPTASNAQTQAVYGLAMSGATATAAGGVLQFQLNATYGEALIGTFAGNVTLEVDLGYSGPPGSYGTGFRIGSNRILFHPGFGGGAFRIEGPAVSTTPTWASRPRRQH